MSREHESDERLVAQNRRARHDYFILETFEAGLVLSGTEVKSLRLGKASLAEAYATVENGEAFVLQLHIPPYEQGNRWNLDPVRRRKLLLHGREITRLVGKISEKGLTVVPLKLYFKGGRVKMEVGLARGKKLHDKRATLRERETRREMDKAARAHQAGRW